ncbi:MAG: hypothetical protein IPP13_11895 [Kouleothrix sp.]|jgi:DNA-binding transcriptional MocR family regulator|nr:hypothetical protein [Kouleothrix sp.]
MPKQTPDLPVPGIRLDATAEQPLHRQLYRQLSHAIRLGHLKPIPALQGLDEAGRVIYLGTFSKVFSPALRLVYMVVPSVLIDLARIAQRVMSFHAPIIEQIAMTTFMAEGDAPYSAHAWAVRGTARLLVDACEALSRWCAELRQNAIRPASCWLAA